VIQTTWDSAAPLIQLQAHRHQFDKLVAKPFSRGENGLAAGFESAASTADFQAFEGLRGFWDVD
jgi:hypothetical protein